MKKNPVQEELNQLKDKLQTLMLERWELYQKYSNFSAEGCPSKGIMDALKHKTSDVNRVHNQVNKLRLDLGDSKRDVKEQDVRRIMNPNGNTRCNLLFKA